MQSVYIEKEVLGDGLAAAKMATNEYNLFSNECVHEPVRMTALKLLADEHSIQQDIFQMMHSRGLYPTPEADASKVEDAKSKFENCCVKCK